MTAKERMVAEEKFQAMNRARWKLWRPALEDAVRRAGCGPTEFVGYDTLECETDLIAVLVAEPCNHTG